MLFQDRKDAGQRLAFALRERRFERPVVLGIPRGGVPVAAEVARALGGDLAVVVARKLGAPGSAELAIGATTANGVAYVNETLALETGADAGYLARERERQTREARRREELFNGHRRPPVAGRIVIIVDDGVATGATAIAAVRSMKVAGAERVILAVPVGPPGTIAQLRQEADEVVCLYEEPDFWAVGQYYVDFSPVEDSEVKAVLDAFMPAAVPDPRDFVISRDHVTLSARVLTPPGDGPFPCVVFVHGLGSSKESPRNVVIAEHLADAGIAALLFDLSGHGESSADPLGEGEAAYVADVTAVFRWAQARPELDAARLGLAGSSLGAVIAVRAVLLGLVRPETMVLRAPPLGPGDFDRLDVPSLVIIGSEDPLLASVKYGVARSKRASLAVVEGASHLFEEPGTLEEVLKATVSWFSRWLAPAATPSPPRR